MEILSRSSLIMPPSSCLRQHQLSDEECYSSVGASPVISPSPIASPPSVLLAPPPLPSTDCSCSDFWFGSEDSMQTKIIHSRYMNNFDLSTTRQHASRAPIAFIGLIIRRRITKQIYYQIMQSSHVNMQNNHHNANQKMKRKKKQKGDGSSDHSLSDDDRWHCCQSNESPSDCDSCRLYTIDEITINQRDCVPLGFTMKRIESSTVVTIWDNYDGLPLHQHRLRRWPEGIIEKNSLKPHSYIECNPLYDDDPTGLHCTDASFVYSTHRFTNDIVHANVSATSGERMCLGYASMNQPCILDALRRFGRPSDAEAVRQLNATGQEGAETDETHTGAHPHTDVSVCTQPNNDDAENTDDRSAENEDDQDDDDVDDEEWSDDANDDEADETVDECSDDEDNRDNDDADDEDDLPSSAQPNPLRRHHTDGGIQHRGSRSKSVRSQSDDDAHEAAKLMAKLGLCTLSDDSSHQKMLKNTRNKFSGSTDAECEDDDDDIDERLSDDDQFSIHLHPCDHGWK